MLLLESDIGTAKDNTKSPIHNWYKFTAGFSYKFIDEIIQLEKLTKDNVIFDPFAGCGTTLVSAQKHGIPAIGYEGQRFMFEIIKGKLNWNLSEKIVIKYLLDIQEKINKEREYYNIKSKAHELLLSLYENENLKELYLIKDFLYSLGDSSKYFFFLKLALSQTLHKVSFYPIAVPYIVRRKLLYPPLTALETFIVTVEKMLSDLNSLDNKNRKNTSKIYLQDSRKKNRFIDNDTFDICITSPPYLNNLDYGEVSKVHTHFFEITSSWNDITHQVRKKLVTASTTHYVESNFNFQKWKKEEFFSLNTTIGNDLLRYSNQITEIRNKKRKSKSKSYDIMLLYYFQDMYHVLKEIRRVLKSDKKAFLILGDSAPYGIFIPTTEIMGKIALNTGFNKYEIFPIRKRGGKWKGLKHRHKQELNENVLILE